MNTRSYVISILARIIAVYSGHIRFATALAVGRSLSMSDKPQANTESIDKKMSPAEVQMLVMRVEDEARGFRRRRIWKKIAGGVIIMAVFALFFSVNFKGGYA